MRRPDPDPGRAPAGRLRTVSRQGDRAAIRSQSRRTIFKDGHDILRAVVRYRTAGSRRWLEEPLEPLGNDRWAGELQVSRARPLAVHDRGLGRPLRDAARRARPQARRGPDRARRRALRGGGVLRPGRAGGMARHRREAGREGPARQDVARQAARGRRRALARSLRRLVRALSAQLGRLQGRPEGAAAAGRARLRRVYLPPIHPIGETNRKGRNNALVAAKGDPGSPWAIGGQEGRSRRDPSRARDAGRLRQPRRRRAEGRTRDRARLRDPDARPTIPG